MYEVTAPPPQNRSVLFSSHNLASSCSCSFASWGLRTSQRKPQSTKPLVRLVVCSLKCTVPVESALPSQDIPTPVPVPQLWLVCCGGAVAGLLWGSPGLCRQHRTMGMRMAGLRQDRDSGQAPSLEIILGIIFLITQYPLP